MSKNKSRLITNHTITTKDNQYIVNTYMSQHALERYRERNVNCNMYVLASNIMALGTSILSYDKQELCIIDKVSGFTLIVAIKVKGLKVFADIITVIDKSNVFVKSHTTIVKIDELF